MSTIHSWHTWMCRSNRTREQSRRESTVEPCERLRHVHLHHFAIGMRPQHRDTRIHAQIEQIPVRSDSEGRLRSFARSGSLRVSYSTWAHDYGAVLSSASPRRSFNDYTRHVSPDTSYADDRLDDQRRHFAGLLFFSRRFQGMR